jgi:hypothetical protein
MVQLSERVAFDENSFVDVDEEEYYSRLPTWEECQDIAPVNYEGDLYSSLPAWEEYQNSESPV